MASIIYNRFKKDSWAGVHKLNDAGTTYKYMLVKNTYVPDPDHELVSEIKAPTDYEISGTGYAAGFAGSGRKALTNRTLTQDNTNDKAIFTGDTITWTALNAGTVGGVILFLQPAGAAADSDNLLVAFLDFNDQLTNGTDFIILPDVTNGLMQQV